MEKKEKTIDIIKQQRKVSASVIDGRKLYSKNRKALMDALKEGPKTIPQLSEFTQISLPDTTYYLMALLKFGDIVVNRLDDMDEYYFYELKNR
ncbi:MAG: hypothetical protein Q8880_10210 [Bacteroidota bacterium]|nr:hypothetical protein [Bacteroidota bacterium]